MTGSFADDRPDGIFYIYCLKCFINQIYDKIYVEDLATAEGRERSGQAGARGRPALHLARFVS